MTNRKTTWPSAIGSLLPNLIALPLTLVTFNVIESNPLLAIPVVFFGL